MLYGLIALFLLLPAVFGEADGGPVRRLLGTRMLSFVGLISYAFYLYHSIVIAQLNRFASDHGIGARYAFVVVLSLVVSMLCAVVSFYVLERPLMRVGQGPRARTTR